MRNEAQSQKLAIETKQKAEKLMEEARSLQSEIKSIQSSSSPEKRSKMLSPVRRKIAELEDRENSGSFLRVLSPERVQKGRNYRE